MTVVTHDGVFHADECMAIALLKTYYSKELNVVRSRDKAVIEAADMVIDVGKRYNPVLFRFDHHQNHNLPAACKLIVEWLMIEKHMPEAEGKRMMPIIDFISDIDIGKTKSPIMGLNYVIRLLNQNEDGFMQAVTLCQAIVEANQQYTIRMEDAGHHFSRTTEFMPGVLYAQESFVGWKELAVNCGYGYMLIPDNKQFVLISADTDLYPIPMCPQRKHSGVAIFDNIKIARRICLALSKQF